MNTPGSNGVGLPATPALLCLAQGTVRGQTSRSSVPDRRPSETGRPAAAFSRALYTTATRRPLRVKNAARARATENMGGAASSLRLRGTNASLPATGTIPSVRLLIQHASSAQSALQREIPAPD
ncbi:hypothetical protein PHLGIDRAFT_119535 [Phlebiopsis gigantea 11061_1 CR5-6]|uniref:Uncharacterized protein n=1 Tax=Phlebiopsis gigantea (strain 11061_1 CR5-6) TaxID=745531 RepID=A0A0C3PIE3_PHLG1|nr:hypothetical protein PHLGIDRAFT_119535 [Phlebiopsis gigantea 11061_1 CR5-6]